jgi:hypothetical protein
VGGPRRVRLLFDENLSSRLAGQLIAELSGSTVDRDRNLVASPDVLAPVVFFAGYQTVRRRFHQ